MYAGATFIQSPNFWANRFGHTPSWIIVHGTAGGTSAKNIAAWFAKTASEVSAHYIIDPDGSVVCSVQEFDAAWANGVITDTPEKKHDPWWTINPNLVTISIEHVKADSANASPLTSAQSLASFRLIKDIGLRWHIPLRAADGTGGITGHFSMDPKEREHCPGNYPWADLWNFLKESSMIDLTNPVVARYFQLVGPTQWKCKNNGFIIRDAILSFYQKTGGIGLCGLTELGMPTENDHPGARPGTYEQAFERGLVRSDPSHLLDSPPGAGDVYMAHLEQYYALPAKLQEAVATIQTMSKNLTLSATALAENKAQIAALQQENATLTQNLAAAKLAQSTPLSSGIAPTEFDTLIARLQSVESSLKLIEVPVVHPPVESAAPIT